MTRATDLRARFRDLHLAPDLLVMPNPWDVGSAKIMEAVGCVALATTSAGMAGSIGKNDQKVTRNEMVAHAEVMATATDLPLNIDSEDCFADDLDGVAHTATLLAATDAAGFSIEDYDPRTGTIRSVDDAAQRVAAAKQGGGDLVLTARAEQHLYGDADVADTIARLQAYRDAGADVLYAPGLLTHDDIARVVEAVDAPINVLALPGTPPIPTLADLGVARVSVGSMLAWAAYGAVVGALDEIMSSGTANYAAAMLSGTIRRTAFG